MGQSADTHKFLPMEQDQHMDEHIHASSDKAGSTECENVR